MSERGSLETRCGVRVLPTDYSVVVMKMTDNDPKTLPLSNYIDSAWSRVRPFCCWVYAEVCMSKDVTVARRWTEGISQNLLVTLAFAAIPGGAVTYLSHMNSVWATPALRGLEAAFFVSITVLAVKGARRLPAKRIIPTVKNIESCVRLWLDHFRVGVRNDPQPAMSFRVMTLPRWTAEQS